MQNHRQRHNELLARHKRVLEAIDKVKEEQNAFISDITVTEKFKVLQSLKDLADDEAPKAARLCLHTRSSVVEKIATANALGEKMTAKAREIDSIQCRVQMCLQYASQLLQFRNVLRRFEFAMGDNAYQDASECIMLLSKYDKNLIEQIDYEDRMKLSSLEGDCRKQIKGMYHRIMNTKNWDVMDNVGAMIKAIGKEYQIELFQEWLTSIIESLRNEWHHYLIGTFSISELVQQFITVFNRTADLVQEFEVVLQNVFFNVDGLGLFVKELYEAGEKFSAHILQRYMQQREFNKRMSAIRKSSDVVDASKENAHDIKEKKEAELAMWNEQLDEVARILQHTQTFERFMRSRCTSATSVTFPDNRENELGRSVQELAGYFCCFENELLNHSTELAFECEVVAYVCLTDVKLLGMHDTKSSCTISVPASSTIDEIFYVARNSAVRSLATGHVDCAAGVLNMINTLLKDRINNTMQSRMQFMPQYVRLASESTFSNAIVEASNQLRDQMQQQVHQQLAKLSKSSTSTFATSSAIAPFSKSIENALTPTKLSSDVLMNSLEVSIEYIEQMTTQLEAALPQYFGDVPALIMTCLQDLKDLVLESKELLQKAQTQLVELLQPRLKQGLGSLLLQNHNSPVIYELTEDMFTYNEANDPFARNYIILSQDLLDHFTNNLSKRCQAYIALLVAQCTADWIFKWFKQHNARFNQLGALQFDKDIRVLSTFFAKFCDSRTIFSKLLQISLILNVDVPEDAAEFCKLSHRGLKVEFSASEVKEILARRSEFQGSAIDNLMMS